jgi:hypothetical protein
VYNPFANVEDGYGWLDGLFRRHARLELALHFAVQHAWSDVRPIIRLFQGIVNLSALLHLRYVSTSFLWRQAVVGTIVVQSGQRVAHALAVHVATHGGPAERTQHRHPQHAQPVAPVRQRPGRRPRLPPLGCTERRPTPRSGITLCRRLAMASPNGMLTGSD